MARGTDPVQKGALMTWLSMRARARMTAALLVPGIVSLSGTGRAEDPPVVRDARGASGLLADVERIVSSQESGGWFADDLEYAAMHPTMLQSICRATPAARMEALARLSEKSAKAGDARALFEKAGKKWSAKASEAASLSRQHEALRRSLAETEGNCPFWTEIKQGFDGRQTDRNRFSLNLETGGLLQVRSTVGTLTYGGGGVIRLLAGYGFGGKVSVLGGAEFAGGAMLRPRTEPSEFVINYFPAVPLLLRIHDVSWHYDLEIAGVSLFQAGDTSTSYGARVGFALGVSALRTRFVIPWAGVAVAYEHYWESGGRPPAEFFRGGLRVGAVFDP
jgi:hypothetical protein